MKRTLWLLLFFCQFSMTAAAHDGGEPHQHAAADRKWTLTTGETMTGSFVSARGGRVIIRRSDGWLRPLSLRQLSADDQTWVADRQLQIEQLNTLPQYIIASLPVANAVEPNMPNGAVSADAAAQKQQLEQSFKPFSDVVKTRSDDNFFYVESNGVPDHEMMVGITAWQQQVPLPQKYNGENAWRIPLNPVPAKEPMSAKNNFFRGAIAIAVNGVPIFNPIKNDGKTDTLLAGELDNFGGHCGRADDYHYHIAPVHLEKQTGAGKPVGWALDGYPIFGYQDPTAKDFAPLDAMNGHTGPDGQYHYHATKTYPYLNGGFHGEVVERDGQVDPQPRAESPRPALPPLRGAKIVRFEQKQPGSYVLTYDINGRSGTVGYTIAASGAVSFEFRSPDGETTKEEYQPRAGGRRPPGGGGGGGGGGGQKGGGQKGGGGNRPPGDRPPGGGGGGNRPPGDRPPGERPPGERTPGGGGGQRPPGGQGGRRPPRDAAGGPAAAKQHPQIGNMKLSSSSVSAAGRLSVDCTCDGKSQSPAIAWENAPEGTKSFVVSLWHTAPDQEKSYWLLYNIPASVKSLPQNVRGVGIAGLNDRKERGFDPMCSQGPGVKTYHITVYALSEELKLNPGSTNRAAVVDAVKNIKLAETTFDFQYERQEQ
ncbi:MAG: YHYH protein [Planctomyces sp.]